MTGKHLFALIGSAAISIGCLYSVLTHRQLTEADFESVVATPVSFAVPLSGGKNPFVEFRLPDDPIRYRIAIERFKDFDDPSGFVSAASRRDAVLSFHVRRGARQDPDITLADSKPTVFVESMAVGRKQYYPLAKRIEWDSNNQMWARVLAVLGPLLTLYLGYTWVSERKKRPT